MTQFSWISGTSIWGILVNKLLFFFPFNLSIYWGQRESKPRTMKGRVEINFPPVHSISTIISLMLPRDKDLGQRPHKLPEKDKEQGNNLTHSYGGQLWPCLWKLVIKYSKVTEASEGMVTILALTIDKIIMTKHEMKQRTMNNRQSKIFSQPQLQDTHFPDLQRGNKTPSE